MEPQVNWEQAVLGTAIYDPSSMEEALDLMPSDFTGGHQLIWAEMLVLYRNQALEMRALTEALRSSNQLELLASFDDPPITGEPYLVALIGHRGQAMHEYSNRVIDSSVKRQLRQISALIRADAEDQRITAEEALDGAERRVLGLRRSRSSGRASTMADLIAIFDQRVQSQLDGTFTPAWVPRVQSIRDVLDYVDHEDYLINAARPGDGKSSWMRYEFTYAALAGMPVVVFNLENSEIEYAKFAISMLAGIDSDRLKNPRRMTDVEKEAYRSAADRLARIPLYIETLANPPAVEIERRVRRHIAEHDVKLIGVDYIQLCRNNEENRQQDITTTSQILRGISLAMRVPVLANAQMSRAIELRAAADGEPKLSDLRESGSLEQDATIVLFPRQMWLHADERQRMATLASFPQNLDEHGHLLPVIKAVPIKFYIKKNRNGATGITAPILWIKSTNNFRTLTTREEV